MSDEPTEAPGDDEAPTASAFVSLLGTDGEAEFQDLVGKITVHSKAAHEGEDGPMGATVEARFYGIETRHVVHLLLDAVEAQDLALLLAHRAGVAIEESRGGDDA